MREVRMGYNGACRVAPPSRNYAAAHYRPTNTKSSVENRRLTFSGALRKKIGLVNRAQPESLHSVLPGCDSSLCLRLFKVGVTMRF